MEPAGVNPFKLYVRMNRYEPLVYKDSFPTYRAAALAGQPYGRGNWNVDSDVVPSREQQLLRATRQDLLDSL